MEHYCDIGYLYNFTGGDKERIKKYINIFLSSAPHSLAKINNSFITSDWDGVRSVAHLLKPQITIMGIKGLELVIKELEEYSGTKTNLDKVPGLIEELNQVGNKALDELKQTVVKI